MLASPHLVSSPSSPAALDHASLERAFASFTAAAASLEHSYGQLQAEVARLGHDLESTNRDLAASLAENRRMREHLDSVLAGLPCGVLVADKEGHVSMANPEAQRLLEQIGGVALDPSGAIPAWAKDLLEDAVEAGGEREHSCHCGGLEWVSVRQAALGTDAPGQSVFILRDVSQAKRLEQAQEKLRQRQALAELSAVLAHEVRNPLGSLELFAGLLGRASLPAECRPWVEHLQAGLRTLAATVNNVLAFHGGAELQLARTEIGPWLLSLQDFLGPLAARASVRLEFCRPLVAVEVEADGNRLQQVLLNLALNALRAMPHGGVLQIAGRVQEGSNGRTVELEVADNGHGIADSDLVRIFEPGFSTRPGGAGLGLAVCRSIMEQHRGSISVSTVAARGTTFTLQLPLAAGA